MAGLTTASLVGLYEPEPEPEPEPEMELDHGVFADHQPSSSMPRSAASSSRLTAYLGLDRSVRPINAVALASSTLLSITLLVFLNASQPFLLDLLDVPNAGRMTGQLVLADELVALGCYSVWGFISDRIGVRWVAVAGHVLCGVALVTYVNVPLSVLIIARMLFAVGASALVTALSAALSSMTALPESESESECESDIGTGQDGDVRTCSLQGHSQPTSPNQRELSNEHSRLLATSSEQATTSAANKSARFAGLLGFSSGLGALLAVFVLLPLPAQISARFANVSLRAALRYTYYLTAALAFVESLFLIVGLNRPSTVAPIKSRERQANSTLRDKSIATLKEMSLGVRIARQAPRIALGYLTSFTSRASATIVTGFIPLLINHYFVSNGLCSTPSSALDVPTPNNPPFEVCRRALILASILTGVLQLVSLLCSPLVGFLASSLSFTLLLALTSTLGTVAFIGWSFLPHHGDPRGPMPIVYAILAGISQIGGIVISLALVAQARGTLVQKQGKEVAGVIAAAYSVSGGLGILLVGTSAGWLFDAWKGAPFAIVAVVNGVTAVGALIVWRGENRGRASVHLE